MAGMALAFNLLVYLLACIGMMVVFLGGSGYLPVLLVMLGLSLPANTLLSLAGWIGLVRRGSSLRTAWRQLPQWLAVAFWLAVALVLCGTLALLVTLQLADSSPRPWQYLPGIAGLGAAVSFVFVYAWKSTQPSSG